MKKKVVAKPAPEKKKTDVLDETNYRDYAKRCIETYAKKGMLVDSMLWARIIGYYEKEIGHP